MSPLYHNEIHLVMKRHFFLIIVALFALAASSLIVTLIIQTNRTTAISSNLFSISVSNAMEDVIDQLDRLKVEDYISQNDRYKLLKYKRIEDINSKMQTLVRNNTEFFYDTTRIQIDIQDSIILSPTTRLSDKEDELVRQYNNLLASRNKLTNGSVFYEQFVNELSVYVINNIMSNKAFNYELLDTLISEKLMENGIDLNPTIGILSLPKQEVLFCSDTSKTEAMLLSPYRYTFHPNGMSAANEYYIVLLFPKTLLFLKDSLSVYTAVSIILILIIFALFIASLQVIINQKNLDVMKNDFINNMTHEIKTPIASIGLACEMLQDKTLDCDEATRDTYLGMIDSENRRMRMLAETILQSSKMSNKNFSLNCRELDIHSVIENVTKSFSLAVGNRRGRLISDLQASPSVIFADELHVTNMIYNLLDNAIKYSPQELWVRIATRTEDGKLILSVTDHGMGISKEAQAHIFEKFYRVPTGDVHNVKGFGIGLNYVAQVVKLHQGTIHVDSEPGKGTTFTIEFPNQP